MLWAVWNSVWHISICVSSCYIHITVTSQLVHSALWVNQRPWAFMYKPLTLSIPSVLYIHIWAVCICMFELKWRLYPCHCSSGLIPVCPLACYMFWVLRVQIQHGHSPSGLLLFSVGLIISHWEKKFKKPSKTEMIIEHLISLCWFI